MALVKKTLETDISVTSPRLPKCLLDERPDHSFQDFWAHPAGKRLVELREFAVHPQRGFDLGAVLIQLRQGHAVLIGLKRRTDEIRQGRIGEILGGM